MQSSLVNEVNTTSSNASTMKKSFAKELATTDTLSSEQFAVKEIRSGKTAAGKDYIDVILGDRTGTVAGKIWADNIPNCENTKVGEIVEISGKVGEFRGKLQITINFLQNCKDFELSDFLPKTEKDIEKLWQVVQTNIKQIKSKHYKKLLSNLFDDKEFIEKFKQAPAAEKIHHAYIGGLIEHVVDMLNLANTVIGDYPELNRDLLISGVLLHDLGKLEELAIGNTIYRTVQGYLVGHLPLGAIMIDKEIDKIKDFPIEDRSKLINCILGHHEKLEFGSPVRPMTREAFALAHIDNLSAKVNTANQLVEDQSENDEEFTDRNFALETKLYLK